MTASRSHCQECNEPVTGKRGRFCSTPCRQAFNNRRMQRGAQAYDLFRAIRRERDVAKQLGLWTELCRLELGWQEEDQKERPGRRSYVDPKVAVAHLLDTGALPRGEILAHAHQVGRG